MVQAGEIITRVIKAAPRVFGGKTDLQPELTITPRLYLSSDKARSELTKKRLSKHQDRARYTIRYPAMLKKLKFTLTT